MQMDHDFRLFVYDLNRDLYDRDLYYKDPNLFGTQSTVDECIDTLAYTLGESRTALNVVSAFKNYGMN